MTKKKTRKTSEKQRLINEAYGKAYKNYRARVRYWEKRGYVLQSPVKLVKKPTLASIERLAKQTAKKIKEKAQFIDPSTGIVLKVGSKSERKTLEKKNLEYYERRRKKQGGGGRPITGTMPSMVDVILERFESTFADFFPYVREIVESEYARLTPTEEDRKAFAKALYENPDYQPDPTDSSPNVIWQKFLTLEKIIRVTPKSEIDKFFNDVTDYVEYEE